MITSKITVSGTLSLDEDQLRALNALASYGTDEFLKVFYEHMGRVYLEPYEDGLRRLFETIKRDVPSAIKKVDGARKLLKLEVCGKQGCTKPATKRIMGSLAYAACEDHIEEIQALVDKE